MYPLGIDNVFLLRVHKEALKKQVNPNIDGG